MSVQDKVKRVIDQVVCEAGRTTISFTQEFQDTLDLMRKVRECNNLWSRKYNFAGAAEMRNHFRNYEQKYGPDLIHHARSHTAYGCTISDNSWDETLDDLVLTVVRAIKSNKLTPLSDVDLALSGDIMGGAEDQVWDAIENASGIDLREHILPEVQT
jgi:hypothetical protein